MPDLTLRQLHARNKLVEVRAAVRSADTLLKPILEAMPDIRDLLGNEDAVVLANLEAARHLVITARAGLDGFLQITDRQIGL